MACSEEKEKRNKSQSDLKELFPKVEEASNKWKAAAAEHLDCIMDPQTGGSCSSEQIEASAAGEEFIDLYKELLDKFEEVIERQKDLEDCQHKNK